MRSLGSLRLTKYLIDEENLKAKSIWETKEILKVKTLCKQRKQ